MKNINILSLAQAYSSLKDVSYKNFLHHYGLEIRNEEVEDLACLANTLNDFTNDKSIFDRFFVGYKIPQISKEFDLLRFGNECAINIELKKTSTEEKMQKQLIRNKYYLSYIGKQIYGFSFVSDTGQLFFLNNDENLEKVDVSFLANLLSNQKNDDTEIIDDLFNPSDYLVSPFNSTNKFIDNKYFLTHQQEDVKNKIIQSINAVQTASFISVVGSAGTGKTLLIYDIVKDLRKNNQKPLIIHCGYLNGGQEVLKECGWEIIPIKNYRHYELSNYDAIFIDEAQRIYPTQLEYIVEKIKIFNGNCIFSYDKLQTLSATEAAYDIDTKINNIKPINTYKLSEKIRTNKEIATFIKMLFNKKRNLTLLNKGNIELNYFNSLEDAKGYLESRDGGDWEILRFTPSQYSNEHHEKYSDTSNKTSHKVIGQEFDCVAVTLDKYFSYDKNGELIYTGGAYYQPTKMLFQNITRARKKLNLVIIDNEELLNRCLSILH